MDPLAVLGVPAGASADEVAAAYRTLAKRWHPDRTGGDDGAARRMAEINAAYDALRGGHATAGARSEAAPDDVWGDREGRGAAKAMAAEAAARAAARPRQAAWWVPATVRTALGPELVRALLDEELVLTVRVTATWASPNAVLALTDRRLLWLADDAVTDRVHSLRYDDVTAVEHRLKRPLRRKAVLRVISKTGRRFEFAELTPEVGADLEREVRGRSRRVAAA